MFYLCYKYKNVTYKHNKHIEIYMWNNNEQYNIITIKSRTDCHFKINYVSYHVDFLSLTFMSKIRISLQLP